MAKTKRTFTEIEDFFIKGNFQQGAAFIAEKIGCTEKEAEGRIKALGVKTKTTLDKMKIGHGALAMNVAESIADDRRVRPAADITENPKLKGCVTKLCPDQPSY